MKNFILLLILTMFSLKSFSQEKNIWTRDRYSGPGGGLYVGPGGGLYTGPGGGLYTGPGGGLSTGPGGGLYSGPGGGLYTGSCDKPYVSNQPPREALLNYLRENSMKDILKILEDAGF